MEPPTESTGDVVISTLGSEDTEGQREGIKVQRYGGGSVPGG